MPQVLSTRSAADAVVVTLAEPHGRVLTADAAGMEALASMPTM
jgi:hypothetical protein